MTYFFGLRNLRLRSICILGMSMYLSIYASSSIQMYIFFTILSVNSVFSFSELHLKIKTFLLQINNYFIKVDLENIQIKNSEIRCQWAKWNRVSQVHPESSWTSKMELFLKTVKGWNLLTFFGKSSILDVPNTHEKSIKYQRVTEWNRRGKCEAIDKM